MNHTDIQYYFCFNIIDQARMTRAQASKIKEKIDSPNKHAATADADDADDSAGTG